MVCTSLGSLLRPLFYFLFYIHFSLSVRCKNSIHNISSKHNSNAFFLHIFDM